MHWLLQYKVIGFKSQTITFDVALGIKTLSIIKEKTNVYVYQPFRIFWKAFKDELVIMQCIDLSKPKDRQHFCYMS